MPEETLVVVCPNPSCRREIEEPIKLKVLSVARPIEYEACPFCFTRLEQEPPIEQEKIPEPPVDKQEEIMDETEDTDLVTEEETDSRSALLKKVKSLIPKSNGPQKEKEEETAEPETEPSIQELPEEPQTEPAAKEETKEETKTEQAATTETEFSGCKNTFGYLAKRSPDTPIPQECMLCPRIVDCMLKIKAD